MFTLSLTNPRIFPDVVSTTKPGFVSAPHDLVVPMIKTAAPVPRNFRRSILFVICLLLSLRILSNVLHEPAVLESSPGDLMSAALLLAAILFLQGAGTTQTAVFKVSGAVVREDNR